MEVPPIPELPELPATVSAAPPTVPPIGSTPGADDSGPKLGSFPSLPALPSDSSSSVPPASASSAASATPPTTPDAAPLVRPNSQTSLSTPSAVQPGSPVSSAPLRAAADDRYGGGSTAPAVSPAVTPVPSTPGATTGASFASSWPAIQAALDHNDLKQAHQLLSKWHGDESLSPAESQRVELLLGQLAGTVIYSTDNQLEPARVVKQGETLDTIAKEYNVPWQLLAKINGVPAADQVLRWPTAQGAAWSIFRRRRFAS